MRSEEQVHHGKAIAVVDYGIGNLRSAQKALERLGADATLTGDAATIAEADAVVLPGVGSFGACMEALARCGLTGVTREAATDGRPFLGICVGMQMLFEGSDESPEVAGLGVLEGRVVRLPGELTLPQMGWNTLDVEREGGLCAGLDHPAWFYFVHSYAVTDADPTTIAATTTYGTRFVSVVGSGALHATQFHPEKSSVAGLDLLRRFLSLVPG